MCYLEECREGARQHAMQPVKYKLGGLDFGRDRLFIGAGAPVVIQCINWRDGETALETSEWERIRARHFIPCAQIGDIDDGEAAYSMIDTSTMAGV